VPLSHCGILFYNWGTSFFLNKHRDKNVASQNINICIRSTVHKKRFLLFKIKNKKYIEFSPLLKKTENKFFPIYFKSNNKNYLTPFLNKRRKKLFFLNKRRKNKESFLLFLNKKIKKVFSFFK